MQLARATGSMRGVTATLLLLALLPTGCMEAAETSPANGSASPTVAPPAPTQPAPEGGGAFAAKCVHPEARGPARTTQPLDAWQGTPRELLARLADALEDPLTSEPREEQRTLRATTASGTLEYWLPAHEDAPGQMTWRSSRDASGWNESEGIAWLRGVVERFAGAEDAMRIDVFPEHAAKGWAARFGQHVDGRFVSHAGGYVENGWGLVLYWGPAYALPERVEVPEADARATAEAYAECALAENGKDDAAGYALVGAVEHGQLAVVADSLAHQVLVRFTEPEPHTHCGTSLYVHVDALTGAVLGHETPLCA